MALVGKRRSPTVGITHHALDREQEEQDRVPPRPASQGGAGRKGTTKAGAPPRRASNAAASDGKQAMTQARGVKGGNTGGSRAGLRSNRKKRA